MNPNILMNSDNPLLHLTFDIPFQSIRPEHVVPAVKQLLSDAEAALDALGKASKRTYATTMEALEKATERLEIAMGVVWSVEKEGTHVMAPIDQRFPFPAPTSASPWTTQRPTSARWRAW